MRRISTIKVVESQMWARDHGLDIPLSPLYAFMKLDENILFKFHSPLRSYCHRQARGYTTST